MDSKLTKSKTKVGSFCSKKSTRWAIHLQPRVIDGGIKVNTGIFFPTISNISILIFISAKLAMCLQGRADLVKNR